MTTHKSGRNRRIRIVILELLHTAYPGTMDIKDLYFALDNLGYSMPDEHLMAHLEYLREKSYVSIEERKGYGYKISWAKLTAEGWDFIDGYKDDKGIDRAV